MDTLLSLVALLVAWITWWVHRWRNPKCNGVLPPGSMGLPLIGESIQYFANQPFEGIPPFIAKRIARYGPIFRTSVIGQRVVMSADHEINQYVIKQEGELFQSWYSTSWAAVSGNLQAHTGNSHKYLRNVIFNITSRPHLQNELAHLMGQFIDEHLRIWSAFDQVDVKKEIELMMFKLGAKKFLGLDGAKVSQLKEHYNYFNASVLAFPLKLPGFTFYFAMQGRKRALEVIENLMEERRSSNYHGNVQDFLDHLLKEVEKEETILDNLMATNVLFSVIFGAYETTSSSSVIALKLLHHHPKVLELLKEEHEKILRDRGENEIIGITWTEFKHSMTFTHMVINEIMRLSTHVPGLYRKVLKDVNIKGYTIPAGWTIVILPSPTHLDPNEYEDPLSFNPWRWKGKELHSASKNFLAFGGGKRLCAGADMAKLQLATLLHFLVTKYRWKVTKEGTVRRNPGLIFPDPLMVQIREV